MAGKTPRTILALLEPAVWSLAARLLILTTDRKGSSEYKPTVATFYETGIVTALYEALLMNPALAHFDIRHEMSFKQPNKGRGAPKQVDLWLRPHNGGHPTMIEAGDFTVGKVHKDLAKLRKLNTSGTNWFLAFFRQQGATDPLLTLKKHLKRANGLDANRVKVDPALTRTFNVFRPNEHPDSFGAALLRGL